ncbi:uncharacterized protein TrAFT101_003183 [Trichoderma asperellum]|uniref:uncharacterized protein n=1 Tax=Trichoderma asperellum TaxID=101201 RepID=UPI00331DA690|nr:hypothetical protein TrAFT101_003183 [Trichoderma asperellum]
MATSQAASNVASPVSWPSLDLPSSTIGDADEEDPPLQFLEYMKKMERFRAHYSGIHGVVLLLQTSLAMVIVSLLVCMALWKAEEGDLGDESSQTLEIIRFVAAVCAFVVSFCAFLAHAIYILSEIVLLYLQAAILLLTAVTAAFMWMGGIQVDNTVLKFILVGINILFSGMSLLAFVIAAVAWKVTNSYKEEIMRRFVLE